MEKSYATVKGGVCGLGARYRSNTAAKDTRFIQIELGVLRRKPMLVRLIHPLALHPRSSNLT